MAAATGLTTGAEIGLYCKLATPSIAAGVAPTKATLIAAAAGAQLVDDADTNFVGECTDIGGITKTANTKEVGFFRAKVKRRISGIPSFEDMTFQIATDFSNSLTVALRDARTGAPVEIAVVWNTDTANAEDPSKSTELTAGYIRGEIASTSVIPSLDDETLMDVTITPDQDVRWLDV